ncbi:MAG: hypothetical protein P4L63_02510 [Candidatus Pacebacteria bacterium]|nr:hypothetical protein [Candidatus Paceibacterota bacterium]
MDTENVSSQKLNWSALEYEEKERSMDWFWALGIIVITSSIAAIIFNDYFFAVLLILSGLLLGFFAVKKPDMISYEMNDMGLKIGSRIYPYENIKSFWVQTPQQDKPNTKSLLFIKSERIFMPIITVPITEEITEEIHSALSSKGIAEEEMRQHPSEKIMEVLGF